MTTVDSELNGTPPNSMTLTVTGTSGRRSRNGGHRQHHLRAEGFQRRNFDSVYDHRGQTPSSRTSTARGSISCSGAGDTYKVGDQVSIVFGAAGASGSLATQSAAQSQITQTTDALASLATDRGSVGASEQQLVDDIGQLAVRSNRT